MLLQSKIKITNELTTCIFCSCRLYDYKGEQIHSNEKVGGQKNIVMWNECKERCQKGGKTTRQIQYPLPRNFKIEVFGDETSTILRLCQHVINMPIFLI